MLVELWYLYRVDSWIELCSFDIDIFCPTCDSYITIVLEIMSVISLWLVVPVPHPHAKMNCDNHDVVIAMVTVSVVLISLFL